MFDFELFVALRRHLYLIAYAVIDLGLALGRTADYLIGEERLIDYAVEGTRSGKELVVDVRVLGRVNSYEVASLLVLRAGFPHKLTVAQGYSLAHSFMDRSHIVLGVVCDVPFDHLQEMSAGSLGHHVSATHSALGAKSSALYAAGEATAAGTSGATTASTSGALASIVALHSVFDLIQ